MHRAAGELADVARLAVGQAPAEDRLEVVQQPVRPADAVELAPSN